LNESTSAVVNIQELLEVLIIPQSLCLARYVTSDLADNS